VYTHSGEPLKGGARRNGGAAPPYVGAWERLGALIPFAAFPCKSPFRLHLTPRARKGKGSVIAFAPQHMQHDWIS
jgi:hypothetical protein